jgi:xyloglucan-specific exo-beta-1,4-glucanase
VSGLICAVEIDPALPTTLYASTGSQILKSVNGGASWNSVGPPDGSISRVAIAVGPPTILYAASATDGVRIYNSIDGGSTWGVPGL